MAFRQGLVNPYGPDPRYPPYPYAGFIPQPRDRPPPRFHEQYGQPPPMSHRHHNWQNPHGYPNSYGYGFPNNYGYNHPPNYPPTYPSATFGPQYPVPPVHPPPPPRVARPPPFMFDAQYMGPPTRPIPPDANGPTLYRDRTDEWDNSADYSSPFSDRRSPLKRQARRRKPQRAPSKGSSPITINVRHKRTRRNVEEPEDYEPIHNGTEERPTRRGTDWSQTNLSPFEDSRAPRSSRKRAHGPHITINTYDPRPNREAHAHGRTRDYLQSLGEKIRLREEEKTRAAREHMQATGGYQYDEPLRRDRNFEYGQRWEGNGSTYPPGLASRINSIDSNSTVALALIESVNKIMERSSRGETLASSPEARW